MIGDRMAVILLVPTDAWEEWSINILDPDAPDEITVEWLNANPNGWEEHDCKDRGYTSLVLDAVTDYDPKREDWPVALG